MFGQFSPYFAVGVVDKMGNEIWNTQVAYMNHVNDYGQLYGVTQIGSNTGGVQFNYNHDILWQTPYGTSVDSHEVKQIPNGNYMAFVPTVQLGPISPEGNWAQYFQMIGYAADGITNEFSWLGLKIVEFDKETSEEVWSWDPFEHFVMQDHDVYEGTWWTAYFDGFFDWMHSNAFHFDDEESVIYVSHRHLSRISKIAYPSGEVIWNIGMPEQYNTGSENICTDLGNSFQHHIQLMDDGSLLFFDNGNLSEMLMGDSNPTSRIRRIRVIDDSYCETVWQYDLPQNLYGLGMGSVQLLDNGNYGIYTFGNGLNQGECSLLEVTPEGEMIWKLTSQNPNSAWYRSYRIPSLYPYAFSVIAHEYSIVNNENIIQISNSSLDFSVYNESGYSQPYKYILSDLTEGNTSAFDYQEGEFTLEPYESLELSFYPNLSDIASTNINLSIWPTHHDYAVKELIFSVSINTLIGDVNSDNSINILDIVIAIDMVLNDEYSSSADLDNNGIINILDIVQLVNLILD